MSLRFGFFALSAGILLVSGCIERPLGPAQDVAVVESARHAPVSLHATLRIAVDPDLNVRHWTDEKGVHGRGVPADFVMSGNAADVFSGVGTCRIDFDFDPVLGNGSFRTTDEYDVCWGDFEGCFVGRTEWRVRNFNVAGDVVHRGTGECNGVEIRGAFTGRWGQPAFDMVGTIAQ